MGNPPNRLRFKDAKTPFSEAFDDIYFANEIGVEESIYVYLEGTGALSAIREGREKIRIGEVGFGVGLNFLLTLRAFLAEAKTGQRLHYTSVEKFPIEVDDLWTLYRAYPELLPYATLWLEQYPILTPGIHRLKFADGRVTLDLMIGDATACFSNSDFTADFWYWDGFAPSKNPDAFSQELFSAIFQRSSVGAHGSSFTAATWVRKSLSASGFTVRKRTGFGRKRECIIGVKETALPITSHLQPLPWFSRAQFYTLKPGQNRVAVIGAGLAGTAIARALADRGYSVEVIDGNGVANRASSNSAALYNVQLSKIPNPISRFAQSSFTHFLNELKVLKLDHFSGMVRNDENAKACLEACGYPDTFFEVQGQAVALPFCGMINPRKLCETRLKHANISYIEKSVTKVNRVDLKFELIDSENQVITEADQVVYALGAESKLLDFLPIHSVRGQTVLITPTQTSATLDEIKIDSGYITPVASELTGHAYHLLGATYQAKTILENQIEKDTLQLIEEAKQKWPEFNHLSRGSVVSEKVGFRASTPDKLPLIGPLFKEEFLRLHYLKSLRGSPEADLPPLETRPGEWVFMGLGSRGVTFSSLGAEILASMMTAEPLPIECDLIPHLHSVRFSIRKLKKPDGTSFA